MARKKLSNEKKNAKTILLTAKRARIEAKRNAQKIIKEQVKEMRPFMRKLKGIDLRSDISASQRAYIKKAWVEYQELTARPFKIYRTKNKKRLKIAQTYSRHEKGAPVFDVAFIPSADPKAKIKFKRDGMEIQSKYVKEKFLFFDLKKLADNPKQEIERTLARNPDAKQFIIMAGKYLYNGGLPRSLVEEKVINMMSRYSPGGAGYAKRGENSRWENWLFGVVSFEAKEQVSIDEYRKAYAKSREGVLNKRKQQRRKTRVKYGV